MLIINIKVHLKYNGSKFGRVRIFFYINICSWGVIYQEFTYNNNNNNDNNINNNNNNTF